MVIGVLEDGRPASSLITLRAEKSQNQMWNGLALNIVRACLIQPIGFYGCRMALGLAWFILILMDWLATAGV
jgi:hypothetical protein